MHHEVVFSNVDNPFLPIPKHVIDETPYLSLRPSERAWQALNRQESINVVARSRRSVRAGQTAAHLHLESVIDCFFGVNVC